MEITFSAKYPEYKNRKYMLLPYMDKEPNYFSIGFNYSTWLNSDPHNVHLLLNLVSN